MSRVSGGRIELFVGPMYSGKSERLIGALADASASGRTVIATKPIVDTRHTVGLIESHSGRWFSATPVARGDELLKLGDGAETLAVDEVQFLDGRTPDVLHELRDRGVHVVVAGLDLDFLRRPFAVTASTAQIADAVFPLEAKCHRCGQSAAFTQRLIEGRPAPADDDVVRVGAQDLYEARCGSCYEAEEPFRLVNANAATN